MGRWIAAGTALTILAGCGGGGVRSSTQSPVPANAAPVIQRPVERAPAVPPALLKLRASLRTELRRAGRDSGAVVYDLTTRRTLFTMNADVRRPPASVEKLYTTIALLRDLGPTQRLRTTVLGAGHLDSRGTWHGDLYLRGGGDPTLGDGAFNRVWELGYGPTAAQLAQQLRQRGIRRVTGKLIADESLFDSRRGGPQTAFAPDIPDFGGQLSALTFDHGSAARKLGPATFAARQVAATLRAQHVQVRSAAITAIAPKRCRTLATVRSPPLSVLLKLMDIPSDDLFAELLTKQLGVRFGDGGSIASGARVIWSAIGSFGLHPRIVDGSGLSREDRSSPREVVDLLTDVWHTDVGRGLAAALPSVGVNGTVRRIAAGTPARGRCIAKTGTLDYVTNLAGYCAGWGHQMLAFALFLDGPTNERALVLLGRMASAIAKY